MRMLAAAGRTTVRLPMMVLRFLFFFARSPARLMLLITIGGPLLIGLWIASFLVGYFALTSETVVAEVVMSPIQSDINGDFIQIEFTQYDRPSALDSVLGAEPAPLDPPAGETRIFKVYGDTVAIGGPMITLHPFWRLLGFENVFDLGLIEGEYRAEARRDQGEGSEYYINGGYPDSWWDQNEREATFPYDVLVKRVTAPNTEEPGFTGDRRKRYEIVVTMDTITWNFLGYVDG